jgi:hypothetical protein
MSDQKPCAHVTSTTGKEGVRIKWIGGFPQIGQPLYTAPVAAQPLPADTERQATGQALLDAAAAFWSACHKERQYGAVQWLTGTAGELLIYTRGAYREQLMANIEKLPNAKTHDFAVAQPQGDGWYSGDHLAPPNDMLDLTPVGPSRTVNDWQTERAQRPPSSWDQKALETARAISLMWGEDRSNFVSKIHVAVLDAMRWAVPERAQPQVEPVAWQNKLKPAEMYEYEQLDPMWYSEFRPLYAAPVSAPLPADVRTTLERAERKLSAYVGVCKGDKELTDTVIPMVRAALAVAAQPLPDFEEVERREKEYVGMEPLPTDVEAMIQRLESYNRNAEYWTPLLDEAAAMLRTLATPKP